MISIQDLGMQILGGSPKKFYVLGGQEFGIKDKYIQHLVSVIGPIIECTSAADTLDQMHHKQIIPMDRGVYVVRYDEGFLSTLNENSEKYIESANIPGVMICLYENSKSFAKCEKYLPNYSASVDQVNIKFVRRYLHEDFPKLDDRSIEVAAASSTSYGHAKCICSAMSYATPESLARLSDANLMMMFGCNTFSDENELKLAIGSKNFVKLVKCADKYPDDADRILYTILQTMIELDKIKSSKYSDSILKQFDSKWTREDIYYMFMHAYSELYKLRSLSSYNVQDSLIYLFSVLTFQRIPAPEVLESEL